MTGPALATTGVDVDVAAVAARSFVALVHHPVYDRNRRVVATAITNLDIHDIARSARTFGLGGYLIVTPVAAQRELATRILGHWQDTTAPAGDAPSAPQARGGRRDDNGAPAGDAPSAPQARGGRRDDRAPRNEFRREALLAVAVVADVAAAREEVTRRLGMVPLVVATSARSLRAGSSAAPPLEAPELVAEVARTGRPLLILLGTGWGLADPVLDRVDHSLAPIRGYTTYNHLSVRSAAAILLDRLFGQRSLPSPTVTAAEPTARETRKEQVS